MFRGVAVEDARHAEVAAKGVRAGVREVSGGGGDEEAAAGGGEEWHQAGGCRGGGALVDSEPPGVGLYLQQLPACVHGCLGFDACDWSARVKRVGCARMMAAHPHF
jgi:hypothetical protein